LQKLADGLITVVDIQERILPQLIETLKGIKNGKHSDAKKHK